MRRLGFRKLAWVPLIFLVAPELAQAEEGIAGVFGTPPELGLRAIYHPRESEWGGQFEFGSNAGRTTFRLDARKAFGLGGMRLYAFSGFSLYTGDISKDLPSSSATFFDLGMGGELRMIPGAGLGIELGPMKTLSAPSGYGSFNFIANLTITLWLDLF